MNRTLEKLQTPIDWLAASGFVFRDTEDSSVYSEIPVKEFKKLAKTYQKTCDKSLGMCFNELAVALGFKGFQHYQDYMLRKGEYITHAQRVAEKKQWRRRKLALADSPKPSPASTDTK